jgi:hypothetical protein
LCRYTSVAIADSGFDLKTLIGFQIIIMGFLEAARTRGFMATGESGVVGNFPFDPTGQDSPAMKVGLYKLNPVEPIA